MRENTFVEPIRANAIAICMSSSDLFAKYLSVLLASIKLNASDRLHYDIIVLHYEIQDDKQEILTSIFSKSPNISLRFFNPAPIYSEIRDKIREKYKQLPVCIESLSRIFTPILFRKYKRIIFTDIDLVFDADPAELYNQDMRGKPMLAAIEPMWSVFINTNSTIRGRNILEYSTEVLNLQNTKRYFNTGVMLLDIRACLSHKLSEKCVRAITGEKKYLWQEQCVLNEVFGEDMGVLSPEWNWETIKPSEAKMADQEFAQYCEIEKPKVIHFIARSKPWISGPMNPMHRYWWKYARFSPYYGDIVTQIIMDYIRYMREDLDKMSLPQAANAIEEIVKVITNK